ncbi:translocation/assembly module TamB domain-containing protein [Rhabdochromatium marinum]|uniref:translocation/assembly module TamB domain-containing protein n=1 Tax=Rhabdochromatium marinum TaxID=48729 RepID=UPI0019073488|nr:translocation/assembly module TamB domain-containing protein [Rhabdochromatium marinum]MBK1649103.1 hypothetical protein [Rhabdochromatium marinum]
MNTTAAKTHPTAGNSPPPRRSRRSWHPWRWVFGGLMTLLLVMLLLCAWLLTTAGGLRVLANLGEGAMGDALDIGAVEGRLLDQFEVRDLQLRLPAFELRVAQAKLDWRPLRLLSGTLGIKHLSLQRTDVLLAPSQQPKSPEPLQLPEIRLPFALEVEHLQLEQLRLSSMETPEPPLLALTEAQLSASLARSTVDVRTLTLDLSVPAVQAAAQGQVELRDHYPTDLSLDWQFTQAPALSLRGQGQVLGDAQALHIEHRITGTAEVTLDAQVRDLLAQPSWEADIQLAALALPQIVAGAPEVDITAQLASKGTLDQATVTGTLNAEAPAHTEMGRLAAALDCIWQERRLSIRALNLTEQGSGGLLDLHGELDLANAQGQVALKGVWEALRWPLTGTARFESPHGTLDVSGQLNAFDYQFAADVLGQGLPETHLALSGDGDLHGVRIAELRLDSLNGYSIAKGTLHWSPTLAWELALTAQGIDPGQQWPGLGGTLSLKAESSGSLEQGYDYQLKANVGLSDYPAMLVNLTGTGTATAAQIAALGIETLGGRVTGSGALGWAPQLTWEADLALADLDPGRYAPDWPGRLSGQLASQGHLGAQGPVLSARISDFGGQVRGYPVTLATQLEMADQTLKLSALKASSGATDLTASGQAGETLALDFSIHSPDLGELLPAAQGQLEIDGRLRGPTRTPRLTMTLAGQDLELQGQGLVSLQGQADLGLGADDPIQAQLDARNLLISGLRFERLNLTASGTQPNHQVTAQLDGDSLAAQLALSGQLHAGSGGYQAQLSQFKLDTTSFGRWTLPKQVPLVFESGRIEAGPLCLQEAQGSGGCAHFTQRQPGNFDANFTLKRLNFALFDALLPPALEPDGYAVADVAVQSRAAVITGTATVEIPDGTLTLALPDATDRLEFSNAALDVAATGQGVEGTLKVPFANLGTFEAGVTLPRLVLPKVDAQRQALGGQVRLNLRDLRRIGELLPGSSNFAGTVAADFKLGGTLGQPQLQGQAQIEQVSFQMPLLGLSVADANLSAHTQGSKQLDISGSADIGGGQLRLKGQGASGAQGWTFQIKLDGDQLKVADTKEYLVLLKPDLTVEFGAAGASVQGVVQVEQARIKPRSIPAGTVANSPDVVVKGDSGTSDAPSASPFNVDVEVQLSDAVSIEAFGLRGQLRGSLRAVQEPKQPLLGDGQLEVVDGTYRLASQFGLMASIGAPLKIEQGILLFAKTPLSNPGLVLRAQREGGDMTAGVQVLGTLKKPKLAFFSDSDPNMTDSEIVSYLLTGVPPQGDGGDIDRTLSLGAYVAPKLFVEYESNLGDQADKIKMRYELNNRIELQTETGDTQGADVFFKFEN